MAVELDVQTLTNEMGRLEDSLSRLVATQTTLKEVIDADDNGADREIVQAYEENEEVIGSQRERVEMIIMALGMKGVSLQSMSHYLGGRSLPPQAINDHVATAQTGQEEGGIDL